MTINPLFSENLSRFKKGAETKRSLPMNMAFGISDKVLPYLRIQASFTYFLNRYADWDKNINDPKKRPMQDKFENGFSTGIAVQYRGVRNLKVSAGSTYSRSGRTKAARNEFEFDPDANAFGGGMTYSFTENVDFTAALMYVYFHTEHETGTPVVGEYQTVSIPYTIGAVLGITYKAL